MSSHERTATVLARAGNQLPALAGAVLFVYSVCARSHRLVPQDGFYDDGILLSNAHFVLHGLWPYRDFYSNYPPGIFLLLAAVWKVFGISAWAYRGLAIVIHVALALMAGRLAGRIAGNRFSLLAMGMASVWTLLLGLLPYAWLVGLLSGLVFVELLLRARNVRSRGRHWLAGIALGLVGCFRHDLFVYLTVVLALAWAMPPFVQRRFGYARPARQELGWLLGGTAVALGLVWLPTLVLAGPWAPLRDLVIEQGRHVQPARVLPIPPLAITDPETRWPVFLVRRIEGGVVMAFLGPFVAAALAAGRRRLDVRSSMTAVLVGILAVASLPQMLGRTDVHHTLFVVTPAVILAAAGVETVVRRLPWLAAKLVVAAGSIWLFTHPVKQDFWPRRPLATQGMDGSPSRRSSRRTGFYEQDGGLAPHRRAVLDYIETHTNPNERVFFATKNHEWLLVNEVDLYFLANRLPGTRYTQYDPNLETRREVQEEMIASLEQHKVRVVVQSSLIQGHENQKAMEHGSTLLDDYLRTRFTRVEAHGVYTILQRAQ